MKIKYIYQSGVETSENGHIRMNSNKRNQFGERPPSPREYHAGVGQYVRADGKYDGYMSGLACVNHGGPPCSGVDCDQSAGDCTMATEGVKGGKAGTALKMQCSGLVVNNQE